MHSAPCARSSSTDQPPRYKQAVSSCGGSTGSRGIGRTFGRLNKEGNISCGPLMPITTMRALGAKFGSKGSDGCGGSRAIGITTYVLVVGASIPSKVA